ncbi:MAG: serine/threonine protein kinase [Verrucomicrobiales bacterium]|jgi:serine/threonine protein kinase
MPEPLRFQHFQILTKPDGTAQILGQGAMGTTYKAFDTNLHSIVVIKVINEQYVHNEIARQRFLQEAQAMAKIKHPNVAAAFHLSECAHGLFFAMEFCDGPNLQQFIESNGPMTCGDALMVCQHVSSALQAAQKVQLVHRDVKPSNLILVKDEQHNTITKVIDFGLARKFGEDDSTDNDLTAGGFVGTANYASPEQLLEQRDLDTRSDIYSLGVTLWFMLCGHPTFRGSHFETMASHVNEEPPWDTLPSIPQSAVGILQRMLKKSPDERYQDPAELWEDIQRCLVDEGLTHAGAGLSVHIRKDKPSEGSILGANNFEILSEIGNGQTGKVFLGKDSISGERVAVKFLHKDLIAVAGVVRDIRHQLRFLDGVDDHPNILRNIAFDYNDEDQEARIIVEWVEGTNLQSLLRTWRKMEFQDALPLIAQLARGIDFALENEFRHLELALHQILIHTPTVTRDRAQESTFLHQSLAQWPEFLIKIDPLKISWTPEEHASTIPNSDSTPNATVVNERGLLPEESGSLLYRFSYIVYRLLGGVVTDIGKLQRYTQLSSLSESGNEILETFLLTEDPERSGSGCADLVAQLCKTEGENVPQILAELTASPTVTPDSSGPGNLLDPSPTPTSAGNDDPTIAIPKEQSAFSRPSSSGLRRPTSSFGSSSASSAFRARRSGSTFGSTPTTSSGGGNDSAFGSQRREVELKLRRLELERIAAEEEADRIGREEALEIQRRIVEEQRQLLETQKAELEQRLESEKKSVEQERKILLTERKRLDLESATLREEIGKQESTLESEKLRQQYEFQKFLEERKQWEKEKTELHQKHLREQQEAEERLYIVEDQLRKQMDADREALETAAHELELRQTELQHQIANKDAVHAAEIDAERLQIEEQRKSLEARLQRQTLDLDEAQKQVEEARRELQERTVAIQQEAAAKEQERELALQQQSAELENARAELEQHEQALRNAQAQQELELEQRFAAEQNRLDEAAAELAREVEEISGAARLTESALQAAAEEERAKLIDDASRKEQELLRLKTEREALESERISIQSAHDSEKELRKAREEADREALRAREQEIENLKRRLAEEEKQRQELEQKREIELEAVLTKERAALAEERQRIERARETGGLVAADVENERSELEALRGQLERQAQELEQRESAQAVKRETEIHEQQQLLKSQQSELAQRRTAFAQEQADLSAKVESEKRKLAEIEQARGLEERRVQEEEDSYNRQVKKRASEFAALESSEERKLADLRAKVSSEEQRLAAERERIASIERENDFNLKATQQERDDLSLDAGAATDEAEKLLSLLGELKRQQRKRVATIAIGFLLLSSVGAFAAIKGRVIFDNWRAPGTKEWIAHNEKATGFSDTQDWGGLLQQVVTTDKELASDDSYADKYAEVRPELLAASDKAVKGLLEEFNAGDTSALDDSSASAVLSALTHASGWEPVGDKKLLAARLQMTLAVKDGGTTATEAINRYVEACKEDPAFTVQLAPDLEKLVTTLDSSQNGNLNVTRRDELINALRSVPDTTYPSHPRLVLLIGKLVADSAREKKDFAMALQACNDTALSAYAQEPWKQELVPILKRILDDIDQTPDLNFAPLVEHMTLTANTWQAPRPFMILARNAKTKTDEFNYHQFADELGDAEARALVGVVLIVNAPDTGTREVGVEKVKESATSGNPTGQFCLAQLYLELFEEAGLERDINKALALARQAKSQGHIEAGLYEGKALLEKAITEQSPESLQEARKILQEFATTQQNGEGYWGLYISYLGRGGFEKDDEKAIDSLEKGSDLGDPSCMQTLAAQVELEPSTLNLTKARDLHLRLARDWNIEQSKIWLRDFAREAKGGDRTWVDENRQHWE